MSSIMPLWTKEDWWIGQFENKGAFWVHDGDSRRPHPLITSGKHSDRYTNSEFVLEDPIFIDRAGKALINFLWSREFVDVARIQRVVGPAMGAIALAHDLSRQISERRSGSCFWSYTEGVGEGSNRTAIFKRTRIKTDEKVLLCEDVITTGGSVLLSALAVKNFGGIVLPYVCALVNSSGQSEIDGRKVIALVNRPIPTFTVDGCHLCRLGSVAIRPKGVENWARLNAIY